MTYPIEQLTALAKANLDLSLRLTEIARTRSQDVFQTGSKAMNDLIARTRDPGIAGDRPNLAAGTSKVIEEIITDTKDAIEKWQRSWVEAMVTDRGKALEAYSSLLGFWSNLGQVPTDRAKGKTGQAENSTEQS
ncbi:hypothetical protein [Bradyrhizobium cenepequi]